MPTDTEIDIKYTKPYIITEIHSETFSSASISSETSAMLLKDFPIQNHGVNVQNDMAHEQKK